MRYARASLMIVAVAAFLAGCDQEEPTGPAGTAETFDWRGTVAQGGRIEIKNIHGDVRASFSSGTEVVVHAIRTGGESDPASVTIEVVRHEDGVTICAVYPDVPGQAPNECLPGLQGNMSTRNNDVKVEFTLSIPAGVEFVGRVVSGDVVADGLRSNAYASTVNGSVRVTTTRIAEAASVFGSLNVSIGRVDAGRDLAFRTITGDVIVWIPSNTNAEVLASTSSGTIVSDFPLEGTSNTRFGTLGSGGPKLTLSTVDGDVILREGPAAQP